MISAFDFGALGDGSGKLVGEWLPGGSLPLPDVVTLDDLRRIIGQPDLQLTDTIDWAAIMWAHNMAGERPVFLPAGAYKVTRALVFERGGIEGEIVSSGTPRFRTHINRLAGSPPSDVIHIKPTGGNRHFHFRNFSASGGNRTIYGSGGLNVEQHSVFENIYITSSIEEGWFFDDLRLTGCTVRKVKCESVAGHGMRFRGTATLNGAQIENCRMVRCGKHGFWFQNTHEQSGTLGLQVSGSIAEYNKACGMFIQGMQAVLINPYFEANNTDGLGEESDLRIASSVSTSPSFHSMVTMVGGVFTEPRNPSGVRVAGTAPHKQRLAMLNTMILGGTVRDDSLILSVWPPAPPASLVTVV